ncbi:hypothetical protein PQI63_17500, partial [Pseudoalteromonas piscicida]
MLAFLLTACGGGGSIQKDTNNGGDTTDSFSLTLSFENKSGNLAPSQPLEAVATLTNNGTPVSGATITFETDAVSRINTSASVTVTTGDDGKARVTLEATETEGRGVLTASYSQESNTISRQLTFDSEGLIELGVSSSAGNNMLSKASPLQVNVVVREKGALIEGARVVFQIDQVATILPESGAVLTNAEGVATVTLYATGIAGAGQLTAVYESNGTVKTTEFNFTSAGDGGDDPSNPYMITMTSVNSDGA